VSYSYIYGNKETRFIPIHELAHKCKEWANIKNILFNTRANDVYLQLRIDELTIGYHPSTLFSTIPITENEAICLNCKHFNKRGDTRGF
jgi:hypothetical protein